MKLIFAFLFIGTCFGFAQESVNAKSPKIVTKLKIDQQMAFGENILHFTDVISDSRCPTGVTCVWAGEVKLLFKIETAEKSEEKQIVLGGSKASEKGSLIFENEKFSVFLFELQPYPKKGSAIERSEYCADIYVEKNRTGRN